jgi:Cu+-exporting ATPase
MRPACLLVLSLALASCGALPKREREPVPEVVVLEVLGMTSRETCPPRVEAALESVEGVASASVEFATRTATIHCRGPLEPERLIAALRKQGYGAAAR